MGVGGIFVLYDVDFCVFVALLFVVFQNAALGSIHQVGRNLIAGTEGDACFDFLSFRLLHSREVDGGDAGLCGEADVEIDGVAHEAVGVNLHIGEKPLLPIVADGLTDAFARNLISTAHFQPGNVEQQIVVIAFDTIDGHTAQDILLRLCGIDDFGFHLGLCRTCQGKKGTHHEQKRRVQIFHKKRLFKKEEGESLLSGSYD